MLGNCPITQRLKVEVKITNKNHQQKSPTKMAELPFSHDTAPCKTLKFCTKKLFSIFANKSRSSLCRWRDTPEPSQCYSWQGRVSHSYESFLLYIYYILAQNTKDYYYFLNERTNNELFLVLNCSAYCIFLYLKSDLVNICVLFYWY